MDENIWGNGLYSELPRLLHRVISQAASAERWSEEQSGHFLI